MRVWDARGGKELRRYDGHNSTVYSVAFAPGGHRIVSGGEDKCVRVWDVMTGQEVLTLKYADTVWRVGFGPGGRYLLTQSGPTRTKKIWDTRPPSE